MIGHLDAAHAWGINVALQQVGGFYDGSGFIACSFPAGVTDDTGTTGSVMSADAVSIRFRWAFLQTVSTPVHYTGYLDVTYDDVEPPEPPPVPTQFVTILG
jgi:hypothetical protein